MIDDVEVCNDTIEDGIAAGVEHYQRILLRIWPNTSS